MTLDLREQPVLSAKHAALLEASGISPAVAEARGYRTVRHKAELKRLGFSDQQALVPALVIPIFNVSGEIALYQSRPDRPRVGPSGRIVKYETPRGSHMILDVPPSVRTKLADPNVPLLVTEGVRKADSAASIGLCCVAVLGVWNWRGTNEHGGKMALPDWESIALNGRRVLLCFDSDVMLKAAVHAALVRLGEFLRGRGAHVYYAYLPGGDGGQKVGLDDFLAAGGTVDQILALASPELRPAPGDTTSEAVYEVTPTGLVWRKPTQNGPVSVHLTNFTARIVTQIVEDDGAETRMLLELEAAIGDRTCRFRLTASQFSAMNWPIEHLGTQALVWPGLPAKDHARAAIQILSGNPPQRQVYTHLGWRQIGGQWVYLHAGGALGADGPVTEIEVVAPESLARFQLPSPPSGEDLIQAVHGSLLLLELAPDHVMVPVVAGIYRAAICRCDFGVSLCGPTGAGKTEIAARAQQHYGPTMDARNLPGSWSSTGNALEAIAFLAADALVVVDDFAPTGSAIDIQRSHREADRVMRAQGNNAGRQRMRADTTLRPPRPPRGLILSTGEDVPRGQSLRGRMLVVEVSPNDLDWNRLTICQKQAADGLYAQALAGFVGWLAKDYDRARRHLVAHTLELRQQASRSATHRRTPDIVANLGAGLHAFLTFTREIGALSQEELESTWARCWRALGAAAAAQGQYQAASEPTQRFLELLSSAIASGRAHLAGLKGHEPPSACAWGWRETAVGTGENFHYEWRAQGVRVGWIDAEHIYLDPDASYGVVQSLGRDTGESLSVTAHTLRRRLFEKGLLASTEKRGNQVRYLVRRHIEDRRHEVLHIRAGALNLESVAQVAQEPSRAEVSSDEVSDPAENDAPRDTGTTMPGATLGATLDAGAPRVAPASGPAEPPIPASTSTPPVPGPLGPPISPERESSNLIGARAPVSDGVKSAQASLPLLMPKPESRQEFD